MKNIILVSALLISGIGCKNNSEDQDQQPVQVEDTSTVSEISTTETISQAPGISPDSLAMFEDLAVDDQETRKKTIVIVNEILKKYKDRLPNQASYSSMKLFETYPNEFLMNFNAVDDETKQVWVYYVAGELMLRAPENEMKNAVETLERISASCDCNAKEKEQMKAFNAAVVEQINYFLR